MKDAGEKPFLRSTMTGREYPFTRLAEFTDDGESLEVAIPGIERARIRESERGWGRYAEFLPFGSAHPGFSLGEGDTPLVPAGPVLEAWSGIDGLLFKNETANPTWSFKDRGSISCTTMAAECGERITATISTGNMGHSIAAYGARAGLRVIVFLPDFAPEEKVLSMTIHGARVVRVGGGDYAAMKSRALALAGRFGLRIVSGNGPVRAEGYKIEAFEMFEQLGNRVPDFVAVPSSACGHVRGIFKGFRELMAAGRSDKLPRMIVVQAAANSPLASAIRAGRLDLVPFRNFTTVAEALTSGNPPGGAEILAKAKEFGWLGEDSEEWEILDAQRRLARGGFFVEPGSATVLPALRKLRARGAIPAGSTVVAILTGSGMKDMGTAARNGAPALDCALDDLEKTTESLLSEEAPQ